MFAPSIPSLVVNTLTPNSLRYYYIATSLFRDTNGSDCMKPLWNLCETFAQQSEFLCKKYTAAAQLAAGYIYLNMEKKAETESKDGTEQTKCVNWLPLESNPTILNKFVHG